MGYQYVAADGNYGAATGMKFLASADHVEQEGATTFNGDDASERDVAEHTTQHGVNEFTVLVIVNDKDTDIVVFADVDEVIDYCKPYLDETDQNITDPYQVVDKLNNEYGMLAYVVQRYVPFTV